MIKHMLALEKPKQQITCTIHAVLTADREILRRDAIEEDDDQQAKRIFF